MLYKKRLVALAVSAAVMAPFAAHATNGMNLEGYGPIATGMGGAAMAYDNGTAAVMNNPATLGLMDEGNRFDVAVGVLGPNVETKTVAPVPAQTFSSEGDSYVMPAIGWARKSDSLTYGIGVFAQGGMGTDYMPGPGSFLTGMAAQMGQTATGTTASPETVTQLQAFDERSELGVGRIIAPLAYETGNLTVGGSVDYVWANLDLQMLMAGQAMFAMMNNGTLSGSMVDALGAAFGPPGTGVVHDLYGGYFDFSDDSDFTGAATGTGFAGKLGFTFKLSPTLSLGATYHSKTNLDDLEGDATVTMAVNGDSGYFSTGAPNGTPTDLFIPLTGTVKVVDFEWPSTYAVGVAYVPSERWMVVADVKRINWSETMENFTLEFTADAVQSNGDFGGLTMRASMPQNWDDQTVIQIGGAFKPTQNLTLRAGYNQASNPIPSDTLNYLFPATIEQHYTAGFGYAFSDTNEVNFSLTYAPEVTEVSQMTGLETSHSQTNWQLMYSHSF